MPNMLFAIDFGLLIALGKMISEKIPNIEKKRNPAVIGRFGVGLKDALAVLYKNGIKFNSLSRYGDITIGMRVKSGFSDTRRKNRWNSLREISCRRNHIHSSAGLLLTYL